MRAKTQIIKIVILGMSGFWLAACNGFLSFVSNENRSFKNISSQYTQRNQNDYQISVSGQMKYLHIKLQKNKSPLDEVWIPWKDGCFGTCLHAMLIPEDLSTIYHGHPYWLREGELMLPLPLLEKGNYNLWLEMTVSTGHGDVPFLQSFPLEVAENAQIPRPETPNPRITIKPLELKYGSEGEISHLHFLVMLDQKPVQKFGSYVGVPVHSFVLSSDGQFFRHDHAEPEGGGVVDTHFTFPKPGKYYLFLQPTVEIEKNKTIREFVRYPLTVNYKK